MRRLALAGIVVVLALILSSSQAKARSRPPCLLPEGCGYAVYVPMTAR